RPVVLEPLAEAGHVVGGVPEPAVELDDRGVRGPHLEVDLWAPLGPQPPLDLGHDRPAVALALVGRIDAEVVDPATVAVVPGHRRGDDRAGLDPDQEQVGPDGELAADVLARVVPRPGQPAPLPQGDHRPFVGRLERADEHDVPYKIRRYSASYSAALRSQDQSWAIAVRTTWRKSAGRSRYSVSAHRTVSNRACAVYAPKLNPVAIPARRFSSLALTIVSARPPVARTTGGVPYRSE